MNIKETGNYNEGFWKTIHPIALIRDETGDTLAFFCEEGDECAFLIKKRVPKEELDVFMDNAIAKLQKGIELFEKYKKGEIDNVNQWDGESP